MSVESRAAPSSTHPALPSNESDCIKSDKFELTLNLSNSEQDLGSFKILFLGEGRCAFSDDSYQ